MNDLIFTNLNEVPIQNLEDGSTRIAAPFHFCMTSDEYDEWYTADYLGSRDGSDYYYSDYELVKSEDMRKGRFKSMDRDTYKAVYKVTERVENQIDTIGKLQESLSELYDENSELKDELSSYKEQEGR